MTLLAGAGAATALGGPAWVQFERGSAPVFALAEAGAVAPLVVATVEDSAVQLAAADLREDIARVTGAKPVLLHAAPAAGDVLLVGTLGTSPLIDRLAAEGRINAAAIRGRWEGFLLQVVEQPWPGARRVLVVAGSDRRGTAFGLYTLSEQIGVSPWHWWADVPVQRRATLLLPATLKHHEAPVVKYRGIFLNDEAPALTGWVRQFHGGYTSGFYARVFELLLRLRANTLWPAMWDAAFYADDPRNGPLAHERGIVMGTSHHEPMARAQKEWHRGAPPGGRGPWNHETNTDMLRRFWAEGFKRTLSWDTLVTVGMRGDGDEPMSEGENVALLERIVAEQRSIIARESGRAPEHTPQVWALYKEVQGYYESGMRVPDDVLLLWADDNWGNIRRLPMPDERGRSGGAGVYYHFDYVGGPRSYKWLNVTPLPKVWEQMHLAWRHEATRMWIVNVGDLKPMEVPMEFFLRYAWNPAAWPAERLPAYLQQWAAREFGAQHAAEIAELVAQYTRFNGRRKPEQLSPETFSLHHHREAERVVRDWNDLAARAERVMAVLPAAHRDAFFQLVLYPVKACATLNELYVTVALQRQHARQGRHSATALAERAKALFALDAELQRQYHQDIAGGKWNHLMSQPRIGYTSWNQPRANVMPALAEIDRTAAAPMGVVAEGSDAAVSLGRLVLPPLEAHAREPRWVEVFSRGEKALPFTVRPSLPWLTTRREGERLWIDARWDDVPPGHHRAELLIEAEGGLRVVAEVPVFKAAQPLAAGAFIETAGVVAIEAAHTAERSAPAGRHWLEVPGLGRTHSGLTPMPAPAQALTPQDGMVLEYRVHLFAPGPVELHTVLAPTLKFQPGTGLRYAVALGDEPPQVVNLHADASERTWERRVSDGVAVHRTRHHVAAAGEQRLRFYALDAGVVLQRLVLDAGGLKPSYLGPPESPRAR